MKFLSVVILSVFISIHALAGEYFEVAQQPEISVTTTSVKLVDARGNRTYLLIQNKGTQNVYLKFGSANTGTEGILLAAKGNYEPFKIPTAAVYAISESGTQNVIVIEGK